MAYEIHYGHSHFEKIHRQKSTRKYIWWIYAVILIALILAAGQELEMPQWLLPGDPQVTAAALENMQNHLQSGEKVMDAVYVFCQEIVDGAQLEP